MHFIWVFFDLFIILTRLQFSDTFPMENEIIDKVYHELRDLVKTKTNLMNKTIKDIRNEIASNSSAAVLPSSSSTTVSANVTEPSQALLPSSSSSLVVTASPVNQSEMFSTGRSLVNQKETLDKDSPAAHLNNSSIVNNTIAAGNNDTKTDNVDFTKNKELIGNISSNNESTKSTGITSNLNQTQNNDTISSSFADNNHTKKSIAIAANNENKNDTSNLGSSSSAAIPESIDNKNETNKTNLGTPNISKRDEISQLRQIIKDYLPQRIRRKVNEPTTELTNEIEDMSLLDGNNIIEDEMGSDRTRRYRIEEPPFIENDELTDEINDILLPNVKSIDEIDRKKRKSEEEDDDIINGYLTNEINDILPFVKENERREKRKTVESDEGDDLDILNGGFVDEIDDIISDRRPTKEDELQTRMKRKSDEEDASILDIYNSQGSELTNEIEDVQPKQEDELQTRMKRKSEDGFILDGEQTVASDLTDEIEDVQPKVELQNREKRKSDEDGFILNIYKREDIGSDIRNGIQHVEQPKVKSQNRMKRKIEDGGFILNIYKRDNTGSDENEDEQTRGPDTRLSEELQNRMKRKTENEPPARKQIVDQLKLNIANEVAAQQAGFWNTQPSFQPSPEDVPNYSQNHLHRDPHFVQNNQHHIPTNHSIHPEEGSFHQGGGHSLHENEVRHHNSHHDYEGNHQQEEEHHHIAQLQVGHRHEGHHDVEHDSHQGEGSHDHRKENWSSYHHGKYHHVKVKLHGRGKSPEEWALQEQQEMAEYPGVIYDQGTYHDVGMEAGFYYMRCEDCVT